MIYLDNAATTFPKPQNVIFSTRQALMRYGANPGRSGHAMAMATAQQVYRCREKAANFFHADNPDQVVFTLNCTQAVNMALKGLLSPGDHVIVSSLEHNAVMRPVFAMQQAGMITYSVAKVYPGQPERTLQSFESQMRERTRMIVCMHVSNVTGAVLPIAQIGDLAEKHGCFFVVDGAQSAGVLPIDVGKMKIDCLCVPGHKGLYGPMGTGILLINGELPMKTILEGGTGSLSARLEQPDVYPDRLESGTGNTPGVVGLSAGFDFVGRRGEAAIYQHEMALVRRLYQEMIGMKEIRLYTPPPITSWFAPVLSFNIAQKHSEETARLLNEAGIALRAGLHCAPAAHQTLGTMETGTVRVCPSVFSAEGDVNYLLKCVRKIAKDT